MTDRDTEPLNFLPCPFCGAELERPYFAYPDVAKHPKGTQCFAGNAIVHPEMRDAWNTRKEPTK